MYMRISVTGRGEGCREWPRTTQGPEEGYRRLILPPIVLRHPTETGSEGTHNPFKTGSSCDALHNQAVGELYSTARLSTADQA
jgi:hypothetical protein